MSWDRQSVAKRVRQARERAGLTQEQLAQRLGVENTTLSRYERALRAFNLEMLERIADALQIPVPRLIGEGKAVPGLRADEEELLSAYRSLSPRQRRTAVWLVRCLRELK